MVHFNYNSFIYVFLIHTLDSGLFSFIYWTLYMILSEMGKLENH